jgi:hypothetical protein
VNPSREIWPQESGSLIRSTIVIQKCDPKETWCLEAGCNNDVKDSTLNGFHDWLHISLPFRQFGSSAAGVSATNVVEPTPEALLRDKQEQNTADLAITQIQNRFDTYTLSVVNKGPNPSARVQVVDVILPADLSHKTNRGDCTESPVGTLTCDLGAMLPGEQRNIEIRVGIEKRDDGSLSTSFTNTASVENVSEFAGPDSDLTDNFITTTTKP